jgi:acyl carrier protein
MKDGFDTLSSLDPPARDAHALWCERRDSAALDLALFALLEHHRPTLPRSTTEAGLVAGDSRFIADLGYDSLLLAELALLVEDLFDVQLTTADLRGIVTVADLRAHLHSRLSAG